VTSEDDTRLGRRSFSKEQESFLRYKFLEFACQWKQLSVPGRSTTAHQPEILFGHDVDTAKRSAEQTKLLQKFPVTSLQVLIRHGGKDRVVQDQYYIHDTESADHPFFDAIIGVLRIIVFGGCHIPLDTSSVLAILIHICKLETTDAIHSCLMWFNELVAPSGAFPERDPPWTNREELKDIAAELEKFRLAISKDYWKHKDVWYEILFAILKKHRGYRPDVNKKDSIKKIIEERKPDVKLDANVDNFKDKVIPNLEKAESDLLALFAYAVGSGTAVPGTQGHVSASSQAQGQEASKGHAINAGSWPPSEGAVQRIPIAGSPSPGPGGSAGTLNPHERVQRTPRV